MMQSMIKVSLALAVALCAIGTNAKAEDYSFNVISTEGDFSFRIAGHPAPDAVVGDDSYGLFIVGDVPSYSDGQKYQTYYQFYNEGATGGFDDGLFHSFAVDQLFTGTIADPTFKTGAFVLTDYYTSAPLEILTIAPSVPEPSTWE